MVLPGRRNDRRRRRPDSRQRENQQTTIMPNIMKNTLEHIHQHPFMKGLPPRSSSRSEPRESAMARTHARNMAKALTTP